MNFTLITAYLNHLLRANTLHGTHSPFVYELLKNVIYARADKPFFAEIENARKVLLSSKKSIKVTDFGAGSKVNKGTEKQVKNIAKNALKPSSLAQLIFRITEKFAVKNVVELGTCLGITTCYLAKANPKGTVYTLEGCPETAKIAQEQFDTLNYNNIRLQIGNFDTSLPEFVQTLDSVDVLYLDGNHRKDATLNYFEYFYPLAHENSVFILDDIHWSAEMEEAWKHLNNDPRVIVSVDLFYIGLIFFKTDQAKEHFRIRI